MVSQSTLDRAWDLWAFNGKVFCIETGVKLTKHTANIAFIIPLGTYPRLSEDIDNMLPMCSAARLNRETGGNSALACGSIIERRAAVLNEKYRKMMNTPPWDDFFKKVAGTGIMEVLGLVYE